MTNYRSPMIRSIAGLYAAGRPALAYIHISSFLQSDVVHAEFWWLVVMGLIETADIVGYIKDDQ